MDIADIKFCEENFMLVDEQFHEQKREIEKEIARRRAENRSRTKGLTSVLTRTQNKKGTAKVLEKLTEPLPSAGPTTQQASPSSTKVPELPEVHEIGDSKPGQGCPKEHPENHNPESNKDHRQAEGEPDSIGDSNTDEDCHRERGENTPSNQVQLDVPAAVPGADCLPPVNTHRIIPNDFESRKSTPTPAILDRQQADVSTITDSGPPCDQTKTDGEPKKWTFRASGWTRTLVARLSLFLLLGLVSVWALLCHAPSPSANNSPITEMQQHLLSATARTGGWLQNMFAVESKETALHRTECARDVLKLVVNAVAPAFK